MHNVTQIKIGLGELVTTEQADGFMVVSWWQDPASVVPPYAGKWSYEWFKTLSEANDYYNEQEAGEMHGFRPYHILPCRQGVPLGSKTVHQPRFPEVSCSQCGQSFGPGDHGFSHCANHAHLKGKS